MRLARRLLSLVVVFGIQALPLAAQPPCPPRWTPGLGTIPGVFGEIFCAKVFDLGGGPKIHLGGRFRLAGNVPVTNLATWDGTRFADVPGCPLAEIRTMAVHDDGTGLALYVAGYDASSQASIHRLSGGVWSVIEASGYGHVMAMKSFDSGSGPRLYAAGPFSQIGGTPAAGIAYWNGSAWSAAAVQGSSSLNPSFFSLEVHDDGTGPRLHAAGIFSMIGGVAVNNIARFDGTAWSATGTGVTGIAMSLLSSPLGLFAAGTQSATPPHGTSPFFVRWSGSQWLNVPLAGLSGVNGLASFDFGAGPELVTCDFGGTGLHRWNGTAWSPLPASGNPPGVLLLGYDFGTGPSLYGIGHFPKTGLPAVEGIGKLAGGAWQSLVPLAGVNDVVSALAMADDGSGAALFAGGQFTAAGSSAASKIARWNGSSWSALGGGLTIAPECLIGFNDGSGPKVYAGVYNTAAGPITPQRWDGSTWTSTLAPPGGNFLAKSFCVFDDGAGPKLYATGRLYAPLATAYFGFQVCRLNPTAWAPAGTGLSTSNFSDRMTCSLAFDDGTGPALYVGGKFAATSGTPANTQVARWNGTAWSILGTGLVGTTAIDDLDCLQAFDDGFGPRLYAGGRFLVGASRGFARWNGTSWVPALPGALTGRVSSMALFDDGRGTALYLSGSFTYTPPNGTPIRGLLRYSAGSVEAVAGDLNLPLYGSDPVGGTLCAGTSPLSGRLYAGGGFLQAGNAVSPYFAELSATARPGIFLGQPGGAGTGVSVFDSNLVSGIEYFNVFSFEPSPNGVGSGPYLGLSASNPASLIQQVLLPPGTAPFHFSASGSTASFGPYLLPAGLTIDAICLYAPPGSAICASPVARLTTN